MDIFYRLYFSSHFRDGKGDVDTPSRREAIDALINKSRYSRTAEGVSYRAALELALEGVASLSSVPLMSAQDFADLAKVRSLVNKSFWLIRSLAKSEGKPIESVEVEQRSAISTEFDSEPSFNRLYNGSRANQSILEERASIKLILEGYRVKQVEMVKWSLARKKGKIIELLQKRPLAISITGTPGWSERRTDEASL